MDMVTGADTMEDTEQEEAEAGAAEEPKVKVMMDLSLSN